MWSGQALGSSAKCLVAWENCCTTKDLGGIGIKDFGIQNICLLLKLIHRLHSADNSAWGLWVRRHASLANLSGDLQGNHWEVLRSLLPLYQAITTVIIGDGADTSFWNDVWHEDEALADRFPALYSHCTKKDISVREAMSSALDSSFVPRLSSIAATELSQVRTIMALTPLSQTSDTRKSIFDFGNGKLDSSSIYKMLKARQHPAEPTSQFIWKNAVPPRIQFFMWLATKNRIQCRANLFMKTVVDSPACEVCGAPEETTDHILLHCSFAREFWAILGLPVADDMSIGGLHSLPPIQAVPSVQYSAFFTLCCWQLWKRRNAFIFRNEALSVYQVLQACGLEAAAWRPRLPKKHRHIADAWCTWLTTLLNQNL